MSLPRDPSTTATNFIDYETFQTGIKALCEVWTSLDGEGTGTWENVKLLKSPIGLSSYMGVPQQQTRDDIVEHLEAAAAGQIRPSAADFDLEVSDDDDDLVLPRTQPATTIIHYDILHSPTYRTPLLYLTPSPPITLPTLFRTVIPRTHAPQIRAFGPLGAVTLTDHPAWGGVAYLVHPCRTGEAMSGTDESGESRGLDYLMRWIGIVGVGLGLSVPLGMAEALVCRSVGTGIL